MAAPLFDRLLHLINTPHKNNFRVLGLQILYKVGGPQMEWALRMDPINGSEMDKRWSLN